MNLKYILSTSLFLFLFSLYSSSQNSFEKIKNEKIDFSKGQENNYVDIKRNMNCFLEKGLDSIDLKILFCGPVLGSIIVESMNSDSSYFTYGLLYDKFIELKNLPDYISNRRSFEISFYLESRLVNLKNWTEDEKLFVEIGIPTDKIKEIKTLVELNRDTTITYKAFFDDLVKKNTPVNKNEIENLISKGQTIDIDYLLKKSVELKKPILIYFTGFGCVNCRKIENMVLTVPLIADKLLNEFIFIPLYVDDRTELPLQNRRKSSTLRKEIVTIGDQNIDYQVTYFKDLSQPLFVILDSKNTILGTTNYEKNGRDINKFADFLNECLLKFNE